MIDKSKFKIEYTKGAGPGGQNRNKLETAVRITHIETGISVFICTQRKRGQNEKIAWKAIEEKLLKIKEEEKAAKKAEDRYNKISNTKTVRTYDFKTGLVHDHRTGKTAPVKQVLKKGRIDLLK